MRAVNLIPAEHREGAAVGVGRSEGAAYAVMALILGVSVMIWLYGGAKSEVSSRTAQAASLAAQAQAAQAQASQLAPYTSFVALREQRQQDISTLVDSRFDWAHALHELGRVLPPFVTLESMSGSITAATSSGSSSASAPAPSTPSTSSTSAAASTAAVASATPPGAVPTFTLTGCAVSQKIVALMLERLRLIDGVSTVSLQSSSGADNKLANKTGANPKTGTSPKTASSSTGACGPGGPQFSVSVAYEALPSTAAETASATAPKRQTVASTSTGSTSAATTSGSVVK